ncbi:hypothetical protein RFI_17808, partial [Reticulomyxa filosa]
MFDVGVDIKAGDNARDDKLLEDKKSQVFRQHKREASQFDALKRLFGEEVEEELAIGLAKDAIEEHKVNVNNEQGVTGHFEVQDARLDDEDYIILANKETKRAALVVKKDQKNSNVGRQLQDAVDRAFNEHSRKISLFRSLEDSLKGIVPDQLRLPEISSPKAL